MDDKKIKDVVDMTIKGAVVIKEFASSDDWDYMRWYFYEACKKIITLLEVKNWDDMIRHIKAELQI